MLIKLNGTGCELLEDWWITGHTMRHKLVVWVTYMQILVHAFMHNTQPRLCVNMSAFPSIQTRNWHLSLMARCGTLIHKRHKVFLSKSTPSWRNNVQFELTYLIFRWQEHESFSLCRILCPHEYLVPIFVHFAWKKITYHWPKLPKAEMRVYV